MPLVHPLVASSNLSPRLSLFPPLTRCLSLSFVVSLSRSLDVRLFPLSSLTTSVYVSRTRSFPLPHTSLSHTHTSTRLSRSLIRPSLTVCVSPRIVSLIHSPSLGNSFSLTRTDLSHSLSRVVLPLPQAISLAVSHSPPPFTHCLSLLLVVSLSHWWSLSHTHSLSLSLTR